MDERYGVEVASRIARLEARVDGLSEQVRAFRDETRSELREMRGQLTTLVERTSRLDERVPEPLSKRKQAMIATLAAAGAAMINALLRQLGIGQ